jgi:hypothetical protein
MNNQTLNCFVKLSYTYTQSNHTYGDLINSYGKVINNQWVGIKYYNICNQAYDDLWNLIPTQHHSDFYICIMIINCDIPPHTDSGILSSINAYIKPGGGITKFYSIINHGVTTKTTNQTNGSIFDRSCLTQVDQFIACPTEVYLLDVTVPHSVDKMDNELSEERIAVCLQSKTKTFTQVCDMLSTKIQ